MEATESNKAPLQFTLNLILCILETTQNCHIIDSLGWSNNSLDREDDFTSIILLKL